ncbi:MAG TPA: hypothetical protein VFA18_10615, partial [Gemmataceae bacterium]|nr:hypothetical protein [Gemmataceae bacterium]
MTWAMRCFLVAILLILPSGTAWADTPAPPYSKLSDTLRDIHNQGARLFNAGDPAAAYYLFQGALQAVEPVLSSRP